MKLIGRKTYFKLQSHIIAFEILSQNEEEFKNLTGITLTEDNSVVCDVNNFLGTKTEKIVGEPISEPNYTTLQYLIDFMNSFKMITLSDIELVAKQDNISKKLLTFEECGIKDHHLENSYFKNHFKGLIELSTNIIVSNYNILSPISIKSTNANSEKSEFVPVYVFEKNEKFFDSADNDYEEKPWIAFFLGNDNSSYGERFKTYEEAMEFVNEGFMCGYKQLRFYNS